MMSLSLGEVAGTINIAVVLFQLTFPLLLVYIAVGIVPGRSNAVTWSVAGRFINGTWWPSILRSDGAAFTKVNKHILFISNLATTGLVILAIAAVLTPLGLYETTTASSRQSGTFVYAQDKSPLGQATMPREQYNTSRLCGSYLFTSCPGQNFGIYTISNTSGLYVNVDEPDSFISSAVPENLTEIFSSGREGDLSTVATPFDIEYRSYHLSQDQPERRSVLRNKTSTLPDARIDNFAPRTVGEMQYGEMIVLADGFVIRDGIVADMKKGGIGFRNHTIPADIYEGSSWTEGLLWLEPETVCIPCNISLELHTSLNSYIDPTVWLVDNGGIVNLTRDFPFVDLNDTQRHPELSARAYAGATLVNFNIGKMMGILSDRQSYVGRKFLISNSYTTLAPGKISMATFDGKIPELSDMEPDPRKNITLIEAIDIALMVTGYGGADKARFGRIANTGGLVLGAMVDINTGTVATRFDPGMNWTAPFFACSTSIRAFIMDVTFSMNGSSSLDSLRVRSAVPRKYTSNATTPLWAIENTLNMNISAVQPIWGLVNDSYEHDQRLWTIRQDHMYLPAGSEAQSKSAFLITDALACGGPLRVLGNLYSSRFGREVVPDFTGSLNLPLRWKWQGLSKTPAGISTMMGLIWTDMTANYLTSARSQLNRMFDTPLTNSAREFLDIPISQVVEIQVYTRQIRYRIPYAIAGIIFLVLYVMVLFTALFMCVTRRSTTHLLRNLLNQTSVGRAVTVERYGPDVGVAERVRHMSTIRWVSEYGDEDIGIIKGGRPDESRKSSGENSSQEYQPVSEQVDSAAGH